MQDAKRARDRESAPEIKKIGKQIFEQANRHYETNVVKLMTCTLLYAVLTVTHIHSLFYLLERSIKRDPGRRAYTQNTDKLNKLC